jgi:hypothetical protein
VGLTLEWCRGLAQHDSSRCWACIIRGTL